MFQNEENNGASFAPFILGVVAGVVGTLIFATYYEDKFQMAVSKTREIGDKAGDVAGDVKEKVVEKARNVGDAAQEQMGKVKQKAQDMIQGQREQVGVNGNS
jgi:hypothetical protein